MKKILLLFILLSSCILNSQNITGIIASSINKGVSAPFTFTTTSVNATWTPWKSDNDGSTLTWVATGAVTDTQVADKPTFDFSSGGGGDIDLSVTVVSQIPALWLFALNLKTINPTALGSYITDLRIDRNQLTSIDLSANTGLEIFHIYSNTGLGSIDVSDLTLLDDLRVDSCGLTEIDISSNTVLSLFRCNSNSITLAGLTLTNSLTLLACYSNPLAGSLDVSSLTAMTNLDAHSAQLTGLTLGGGALTNLTIWGNAGISTINISAETGLTYIVAFSCGFVNGIDFSSNTVVTEVWVYQNNFTVTATNQLLADLVANAQNNGVLKYRNNETGQGVTDRATLITRGWTITNFGT